MNLHSSAVLVVIATTAILLSVWSFYAGRVHERNKWDEPLIKVIPCVMLYVLWLGLGLFLLINLTDLIIDGLRAAA